MTVSPINLKITRTEESVTSNDDVFAHSDGTLHSLNIQIKRKRKKENYIRSTNVNSKRNEEQAEQNLK